jgi:hypothetical protein
MNLAFRNNALLYSTVDGSAREMERLCLQIFDRWCEQRNVIPLAYLFHAWPIVMSDRVARTRLLNTLQDLRHFHADALTPDDESVIERLMTMHV